LETQAPEFEHAVPVTERAVVAVGDLSVQGRDLVRARATSAVLTDMGLLAIALGAGTFLRTWQINRLGINSDEAVYIGQAAGIVGDPTLSPFFPVFRAHPLLFQFLLALIYPFAGAAQIDLAGRLLAAAIGIATIYVVYRLGADLYSRRSGVIAALLVGLMPYHVIVTRQVLLDGPMTLFATLTLYLLALFCKTQRPIWIYAAGACMGMTFLAKETGLILVGAVFTFFALAPEIRVRLRDLVLACASMALIMAPFPLSMMLAGGGGSERTGQYVVWQLFRRPNHTWDFYPTTVPLAIGPLVVIIAVLGLWLARKSWSWREKLLLAWIAVPVMFFQLWPVKGFQYLLPIVPPVSVLAAVVLVHWTPSTRFVHHQIWSRRALWPRLLAICIVAITLAMPSWARTQARVSDKFLAGSGGVPGGRETGLWVRRNVPEDAAIAAIGPSMANIIQFYGHRKAYGLSVSPNPLHRNPSYEPLSNPDFRIRDGDIQYLVWDSFSAARSPFFAEKLNVYIERYNGRLVHAESIRGDTANGESEDKSIIKVFEVRP
jgi:hypothetical protein